MASGTSLKTPNVSPATLVANNVGYKIEFATTITGTTFLEPYSVSGPFEYVAIPLGYSKAVIPISSPTPTGVATYLKIHYPQFGGTVLYITFAKNNSSWVDGYEDIDTVAELTAIKPDLIKWVTDGATLAGLSTTVFTKILTFSVIGITTNNPDSELLFTASFQYTYYPSTVLTGGGSGTLTGGGVGTLGGGLGGGGTVGGGGTGGSTSFGSGIGGSTLG